MGSAFTIEAGVMYNRELPAIKNDRLAHVILLRVFIKHPTPFFKLYS
ncbi:D-stereospecific peptide hydrolase [Bacillus cereus ATCC 10876]|nr:D-stereospecific peptide hydrolase [Bacillus cereus ATCC 10876]